MKYTIQTLKHESAYKTTVIFEHNCLDLAEALETFSDQSNHLPPQSRCLLLVEYNSIIYLTRSSYHHLDELTLHLPNLGQ